MGAHHQNGIAEKHIFIRKHNVYIQSEPTIIWVGIGKEMALIKRIKLKQEFEIASKVPMVQKSF